jgi:hypothetical protein
MSEMTQGLAAIAARWPAQFQPQVRVRVMAWVTR